MSRIKSVLLSTSRARQKVSYDNFRLARRRIHKGSPKYGYLPPRGIEKYSEILARARNFKRNMPALRTSSTTVSTAWGPSTSSFSYFKKVSVGTPNFWYYWNNGLTPPFHSYTLTSQRELTMPTTYEHHSWSPVRDSTGAVLYYADIVDYSYVFTPQQLIGYPASWDYGSTPETSEFDLINNRLLQKLASNKASLGEFVGEFDKTWQMFRATARRITRCAVNLRSFNIRAAASSLAFDLSPSQLLRLDTIKREHIRKNLSGSTFLANVWLEYIYGWKPLVSDLFGLMETLAGNILSDKIIKRISKSKTTFHTGIVSSLSGVGFRRTEWLKYHKSYKVVLYYRVSNSNSHMREELGLGNPALIVWNLLPYSFIVDWFIGIGDFLQQMSATSGLTFQRGTNSYTCRSSVKYSLMYSEVRPPIAYDYFKGALVETQSNLFKVRNVLVSFPAFQLQSGSGLNYIRSVSALALLKQTFGHTGPNRGFRRV